MALSKISNLSNFYLKMIDVRAGREVMLNGKDEQCRVSNVNNARINTLCTLKGSRKQPLGNGLSMTRQSNVLLIYPSGLPLRFTPLYADFVPQPLSVFRKYHLIVRKVSIEMEALQRSKSDFAQRVEIAKQSAIGSPCFELRMSAT